MKKRLDRSTSSLFPTFLYLHSNSTQILALNENGFSEKKRICQKKKIILFGKDFFFSEKPFFLGLKFEWNLSVNTERSGTDYCWLYCAYIHSNWRGFFFIPLRQLNCADRSLPVVQLPTYDLACIAQNALISELRFLVKTTFDSNAFSS